MFRQRELKIYGDWGQLYEVLNCMKINSFLRSHLNYQPAFLQGVLLFSEGRSSLLEVQITFPDIMDDFPIMQQQCLEILP